MGPILLAYFGVGLMVALSGVGSAWGVAITGNATEGALKKNPDAFGSYLTLSALPGSQGLYGFIGFIMIQMVSGVMKTDITWFQAAAVMGGSIATGTVCLVSAIHQARICANGIASIGTGNDVFGKTLILAAFPELYAILSLVVTILIAISLG